ncbi:DoxX family protein [Paenibacillus sp. SYP-B3998]|uniref:DoxX family protein n=1 Tax=Paenibacillus sp. SYP-B3998 TaxID=2678564 RepID=A0A6G4A225_9BACL|nr:DoxX family protein [Paenibacillus sp. SYP-B3998]NEW07697.1 DoxX family protein [Paenibacillus sp. SYP-B3998]
MKKIKITYWVITICTLIGFLLSAVNEIARSPKTLVETTQLLGYPAYFLTMLGIAKLIGIIVLLVPKNYRLKEWAYAGFAIDCIAAFWSENAVGNPMGSIKSVVVFLFVMLSYYMLRKMQKGMQIEI